MKYYLLIASAVAFSAPELFAQNSSPAHARPGSTVVRSQSVDMGISFVSIIDDVEIPARVAGPLVNLKIRKGDQISANQVIAMIDNQMALMEKEFAISKKDIAEYQANATEPLELAQATYSFASQRLSNNQRLYEKGAITAGELDESRMAATEAQLAVRKAQHDQQVAIRTASLEKMSVRVADQNLLDYRINAPFDGAVMEVFKASGEWVDEGEKIARVVRMDKLQVQGSFSAKNYNPSEIMGRPVTVTMNTARGQTASFKGRIYSVSLDQTANRRYRVWAEVENRLDKGQWVLRPQAEVSMQAHLN